MKDKRNPIITAHMVLKNKYVPVIIKALSTKPKRLIEIESSIGCISRKLIAENLQYLEDVKIVTKDVFMNASKVLTNYRLTELGKLALSIAEELEKFGKVYIENTKTVDIEE